MPDPSPPDTRSPPETRAAAKARLRQEALSRRDGLTSDDRLSWDAALAGRALTLCDGLLALAGPGQIASGYWPMRSEADPRPILAGLKERGAVTALPAIVAGRMLFRRWTPGEPLVAGGFGTQVPPPESPELRPTLLIVPLAAFDRRGYRIGYGKGYYDAALAALAPCTAVGIGYGVQEIAAVPAEAHDMALDWIVTEAETIRCG